MKVSMQSTKTIQTTTSRVINETGFSHVTSSFVPASSLNATVNQKETSFQAVSTDGIELTGEFSFALGKMEQETGHVLLTGKAGTGKSTLLSLFRRTTKKRVAVLAPTGTAALNVNGDTIHSFFGFRVDITPDKVRRLAKKRREPYAALDAVVIDEASMLRADWFDCVERFLRFNGKNSRLPFGGVQMILVGDLHQLPPVLLHDERTGFLEKYKSEYFFDSEAFAKADFNRIELTKIYRQADGEFINILNAIRNNILTKGQLERLNKQCDGSKQGLDVTLTTVNRVADSINQANLDQLEGKSVVFSARLNGKFSHQKNPAPEALRLKIGAQVMMLNNDSGKRWVNGSMGKVTGFVSLDDDEDAVEIKLENGLDVEVTPFKWSVFRQVLDPKTRQMGAKVLGSFSQFPLKLAWALTIHKSQGKTFEKIRIDLSGGTFAPGQLYVALSRCKSLDGISLAKPVELRHAMVDERVVRFMADAGK
jgi:ATP-dependent DNA helicase PIF1